MSYLSLPDGKGNDLMDILQVRLEQDLAYEIYPASEVATRYGFEDEDALKAWLSSHPKSVARIGALRSAHKSDGSIKDRVQLKSLHALEQMMPGYANRLMHPTTPIRDQTDGLKIFKGLAGMDGATAGDKTATTGATFSLNINFGDRTEKISATVVPTIEGSVAGDDADRPEEDA